MDLKINVDGSAAGNEICSGRIVPLETLDKFNVLSQNNTYGFILQSGVQYNGLKRQKAFVGNNLLVLDHNNPNPNNLKQEDVDYDDVEIVASSMHGILCCIKGNKFKVPNYNSKETDPEQRRFYICKPTAEQWQLIPWPELSFLSDARFGLLILSIQPLRYKIILISINSRDYSLCQCLVFDSNTFKWKWKSMEHYVSVPSNNSESRLFYEQGVQAGRFLYFLTNTHILAFHGIGDKEEDNVTFQLPFPQPPNDNLVGKRKLVIEYQGKLGLICMTKRINSVQLWILEDEESQIWNKIKEIDLSFVRRDLYHNAYPVGFYNDDILVLKVTKNIGENSLMLCNIHNQDSISTCTAVEEITLKSFRYAPNTFPFRCDHETIVGLIRVRGCEILNWLIQLFAVVLAIGLLFTELYFIIKTGSDSKGSDSKIGGTQ